MNKKIYLLSYLGCKTYQDSLSLDYLWEIKKEVVVHSKKLNHLTKKCRQSGLNLMGISLLMHVNK